MNSTFQRLISEATRLAHEAKAQALAAGGKNPTQPMASPAFQNSMAEVARLMQGGNLQAATAAIQAALGGAALPASADSDFNVIDVEAHEVGHAAAQQPEPPPPAVKPGPAGQFISGSHTEGTAGSRDYKLFIPPASFTEPLPLVVMLHGCTQNPDDFAAGTGMNEAASKRGFYVLYPAQTAHANSSGCWNWFKHNHQKRGRGEPVLLAGMTKGVLARYNIDPQRVYVAGLSAGGAMAAILGDAYPDLFAAVGVHSGLATGSASNLQTALGVMQTGAAALPARAKASPPTIVFHGDEDATVNPVNGEHVVAASAGVHKPEMTRTQSANGRDYTRRVYKEAGGRVLAEHWAVHGAGHAWSGGSTRGSYTDGSGPDASEEMLRFFLTNTLPAKH